MMLSLLCPALTAADPRTKIFDMDALRALETTKERFAKSLNPQHKIQYWAGPATMIRAITLAESEADHFEPGKVAMSGGSKNRASPSMAILHDDRMTAVHATASPEHGRAISPCKKMV